MIVIKPCDGGYLAQLEEYGYTGDGNTPEEAKKDLLEVLADVIAIAKEDGRTAQAKQLEKAIKTTSKKTVRDEEVEYWERHSMGC